MAPQFLPCAAQLSGVQVLEFDPFFPLWPLAFLPLPPLPPLP